MVLKSKAETPPLVPAGPARLPFNSTSVRFAPKPRKDNDSVPTPPFWTKAVEVAAVICGEPEAIVDYYLEQGCGVVALTMGEHGVLVATENRRENLPGYLVNPIDATAAGDIFDGAFLSSYVRHRDPFEAAEFANAAAALSTMSSGAVNSIPSISDVNEFVREKLNG